MRLSYPTLCANGNANDSHQQYHIAIIPPRYEQLAREFEDLKGGARLLTKRLGESRGKLASAECGTICSYCCSQDMFSLKHVLFRPTKRSFLQTTLPFHFV